MKSSVLGVIPARYASTRFPGKPLVTIRGKTMIQRVYESAKKALSKVVVATDDKRISDHVKAFGGNVMMTPASCQSGTERMAYVAKRLNASFYVNVQGDEPLMNSNTIRMAVKLAQKTGKIATAATRLKEKDRSNPSAVKVILGQGGRAIYFSRTMIPHIAHGVSKPSPTYKHLGLYVYPKKELQNFVRWPKTKLEQTEKLEQLRALFYGAPIYVAITRFDSIGVDTPQDLKFIQRYFKKGHS